MWHDYIKRYKFGIIFHNHIFTSPVFEKFIFTNYLQKGLVEATILPTEQGLSMLTTVKEVL